MKVAKVLPILKPDKDKFKKESYRPISNFHSAAYDTVNHKILLKKLEYYGVTGKELELFRSYLKNRKHYADITTKKSAMIDYLDCGVVQGSKLSGLLYTIYTNEVPLLQNILTNQEVCDTVGTKYYEKTTCRPYSS